MGKLKQHFDEQGYFDYPYQTRETFVDDSSYDEYRYQISIAESKE